MTVIISYKGMMWVIEITPIQVVRVVETTCRDVTPVLG